MTDVDGDEGFLADPETIIAAAVAAVEPHLGDAIIQAAINKAAPTPAQRRRLAIALLVSTGAVDLRPPARPTPDRITDLRPGDDRRPAGDAAAVRPLRPRRPPSAT